MLRTGRRKGCLNEELTVMEELVNSYGETRRGIVVTSHGACLRIVSLGQKAVFAPRDLIITECVPPVGGRMVEVNRTHQNAQETPRYMDDDSRQLKDGDGNRR